MFAQGSTCKLRTGLGSDCSMHQEPCYHLSRGNSDISRCVAPHACTNTAKPDLWVPLSPPQGDCTSPFGSRSPSQALFPARAGAVPVPSPQPCIPRAHLPQGPKATGDPVVMAGESTAAAAQYHLGFLGLWMTLANFHSCQLGQVFLLPLQLMFSNDLPQPSLAPYGVHHCSRLVIYQVYRFHYFSSLVLTLHRTSPRSSQGL